MNTEAVRQEFNTRIWRIANVAFLWLGLLLPWMRVDQFEDANAFRVALMGLFEFSGLISILGYLFFIGIFSTIAYASTEWIYAITDGPYAKSPSRSIMLLSGLFAAVICGVYFRFLSMDVYLLDITGYALVGYWLYWLGLLSSIFFETKAERLS